MRPCRQQLSPMPVWGHLSTNSARGNLSTEPKTVFSFYQAINLPFNAVKLAILTQCRGCNFLFGPNPKWLLEDQPFVLLPHWLHFSALKVAPWLAADPLGPVGWDWGEFSGISQVCLVKLGSGEFLFHDTWQCFCL